MQDLYREYKLLHKATQQLSPNDKQMLVGFVTKPDGQAFHRMLDNWKSKIIQKALKHGENVKDLLILQTQCRDIAVLKTFQKKYVKPSGIKSESTEEDPATTVEL